MATDRRGSVTPFNPTQRASAIRIQELKPSDDSLKNIHPVHLALAAALLGPALVVAPSGSSKVASRAAAAETRPNVLIIVTDDQRARSDTYEVMPRMRAWMKEGGTYFPNAVGTTPLCCPARASIFTGRYVHNHKVETLTDPADLDQTTTMQYQLGQAGYRTGIVGKYLNGWRDDPPHFDTWSTLSHPAYVNPRMNIKGEERVVQGYQTNILRRRALAFLDYSEEMDQTPWLLYLTPFAPHAPAVPDKKYARAPVPPWIETPATTEEDVTDKHPYVQSSTTYTLRAARSGRTRMLRTLMTVDEMIGAVRKRLTSLGEKNTLVFFLTDNGYLWFEHNLSAKRHPYDGSVQIPFFVSWPGHVPPGIRDDRLVANIDIAPTVYEATGVTPSYEMDGRSLFSGESRDEILLEYFDDGRRVPSWSALWAHDWEYIEFQDGFKEFYAPDDTWQLNNVLSTTTSLDDPPDLALIARRLADARTCSGADCP